MKIIASLNFPTPNSFLIFSMICFAVLKSSWIISSCLMSSSETAIVEHQYPFSDEVCINCFSFVLMLNA